MLIQSARSSRTFCIIEKHREVSVDSKQQTILDNELICLILRNWWEIETNYSKRGKEIRLHAKIKCKFLFASFLDDSVPCVAVARRFLFLFACHTVTRWNFNQTILIGRDD